VGMAGATCVCSPSSAAAAKFREGSRVTCAHARPKAAGSPLAQLCQGSCRALAGPLRSDRLEFPREQWTQGLGFSGCSRPDLGNNKGAIPRDSQSETEPCSGAVQTTVALARRPAERHDWLAGHPTRARGATQHVFPALPVDNCGQTDTMPNGFDNDRRGPIHNRSAD
jgi:hypothetical protein